MNTNEYGNELENHVQHVMEQAGVEYNRRSEKAGAGRGFDSDARTRTLQLEMKRRDMNKPEDHVSNTTVRKDWWAKVVKRAASTGRLPAVITAGKDVEEAMVTLRLRDLLSITDPDTL